MVALLLLIGLGAGVLTVVYWRHQGRFMRDSIATTEDAADSSAWDPVKAHEELQRLQESFVQLATAKKPITSIFQATQRLVRRHPRYAAGHTFLAQLLVYQRQFQQAYEHYNRSTELDGQQPEVHLLAGTLAVQLKDLDSAYRHYSQALGLDPTQTRYRLHLAQIHIKRQEYPQARRELLRVLQSDSSNHQAYASLGDLFARQNKLALALAQIDKAIDHAPSKDRSRKIAYTRQKAQWLRRANRAEDALLTMQGVDLDDAEGLGVETSMAVIEDMALCWAMLGQPAESARLYEKALKDAPTQWRYAEGAARWWVQAGEAQAAERHLDVLKRLNPRSAVIQELEPQLR